MFKNIDIAAKSNDELMLNSLIAAIEKIAEANRINAEANERNSRNMERLISIIERGGETPIVKKDAV